VECGGKGSMHRLFRIFNELHIPCYMLFDYDIGNKDKNTIAKSKELLALAGESQDAPTSLLVSDRVACFPKTWEVDLRPEVVDTETLTAEARETLGLSDGTGKPLIARYIARKLTARNPPVIPPSLIKVIKKAVSVEWKESCLKKTVAPAQDKTADRKAS
jgi:hypothetical protein